MAKRPATLLMCAALLTGVVATTIVTIPTPADARGRGGGGGGRGGGGGGRRR